MCRLVLVITFAALLVGCAGDDAMRGGGPTITPGNSGPSDPVQGNGGYPGPVRDPAVFPQPGNIMPVVPDPADPNLDIQRIQIDTIDVLVRESFPPQISAHVVGVLGDGCSKLKDITQTRTGNQIEINITATHPREAACTMIAAIFDETINLEGDFPAGEYIIRVNGLEQRFKV